MLDASNDEQGVDTGKVVLDSIVRASFRYCGDSVADESLDDLVSL